MLIVNCIIVASTDRIVYCCATTSTSCQPRIKRRAGIVIASLTPQPLYNFRDPCLLQAQTTSAASTITRPDPALEASVPNKRIRQPLLARQPATTRRFPVSRPLLLQSLQLLRTCKSHSIVATCIHLLVTQKSHPSLGINPVHFSPLVRHHGLDFHFNSRYACLGHTVHFILLTS